MTDIERYLRAATRDNTRRSYQAAIEHFESHWGGFLPATAESIARYLADHADQHAVSTLRQRLAALSQWHVAQGFPDPTKAPLVRQVLRGIRTLHPTPPKQAAPLLLQHLQTAVTCFEEEARQAREHHDLAALRRARRDSALLLLGFWRGFRGDELARLRIEHIQAQAGVGITLFLPRSKGDREALGVQHRTPALKALCPVTAYLQWLEVAGIAHGPVFRKLDRWGNLGDNALNSNSLVGLLRRMLERAGVLSGAVYRPLATAWLRHLGHGQWLGTEVADELCGLERRQVGAALHRLGAAFWRSGRATGQSGATAYSLKLCLATPPVSGRMAYRSPASG